MFTREPIPFVESILKDKEDNPNIFWDEDELPINFQVEDELAAFPDEEEFVNLSSLDEEEFVNSDASDEEELPDISIGMDLVTGELLFDYSSESELSDNFSYVSANRAGGDIFEFEGEVYVSRGPPIIGGSDEDEEMVEQGE